ncbi:DUF1565 domain-containing protein [Pendulispora rubella]|uniref:DUF1565 domain-containing protein n=1 Tax=Pendulispora rubella TaxID=2741070 RepID=A0ABZ2LKA7_9BACT
MRIDAVSSFFGLGFSTSLALAIVGCPPSFVAPCRDVDCEPSQNDGGVEDLAKRRTPLGITSVTIDGNPSRMIRQGFGGAPSNGTTTVRLIGDQLDTVTGISVGDGPNALPGAILSKTSTELAFTVAVRHGAPIGRQPVVATAPYDSAKFTDAIEITAITAAPVGSDALDVALDSTGTHEHPLRSMTRAITLAEAGDTVFLKNGTYDMVHGETFAKPTKHQVIPNVPPDIIIKGESTNGTLLQGPPATDCTNFENAFVALATAEKARIETLGISDFCWVGIHTERDVMVKSVAIRRVGTGVSAGANVTLDSMDIAESNDGIHLKNRAGTVIISNSHVHHNGTGIQGAADAALVITSSEIDHNGLSNEIDFNGGLVVAGPTTVEDVKFSENQPFGVNITDLGATGPLVISKSSFSANLSAGIFVGGTARVSVRHSSFDRDSKAIYVTSDSIIDLGTQDNLGENSFTICSMCDGIFDARPATVERLSPISLTGNNWSDGEPPHGCSDVDHPKTVHPPRQWHIEHPGACSSKGNVIIN